MLTAQEHPISILLCDDVFGFATGEVVAICVAAGRIERVERLSPDDVVALAGATGIDLLPMLGKLVLPGLIDAHVHAIPTGMTMLDRFLGGVATLDELEAAVREAAASGGDFVRLAGLDTSRFAAGELAKLDRTWLDGLVPERPLFIKSVEGHSGWFNTRAWERVGVADVLARLELGAERQQEMHAAGRVWGEAYEELTTPLYDSIGFAERRRAMELMIARAQQVGLTGVHCLEGYGEHRRHDFELLLELDRRDDIDLTLYCRDAAPDLAAELGVTRFGGCWCVDGAIGAHSAALAEPYADRPETTGELYFGDAELGAWIEAGLERGMQVCVHAIGERALEQALRIYEGLAGRYDLQALRPRVDHFIRGTEGLARRAAALGVVAAMQPAFDARWGGPEGGYAQRLGPERALQCNPVGAMLACGMRVAGSSDSYITPLDPLGGMRAAMNHHNPELRVDFDAAVRLFSEDAAYLAHQEGERGRIAVGCRADFTVVEGTRELAADARVMLTIKGGRVVYDAGGAPSASEVS